MAFAYPKIRDDLAYTSREDQDGTVTVFVRDPLRAKFFRFNELQAAMMRALDGKKSHEEVSHALGKEFDDEIPVSAVRQFASRLERYRLLDITSYRADQAWLRRRIRQRVQAVRQRWSSAKSEHLNPSPAAEGLFAQGLRQIEKGDPVLAASHFAATLEVSPNHLRAREVLRTIHETFFQAEHSGNLGLVTVPLFNPDRFLGAIDRAIGRFIFHRWSLLVLLILLWGSVQIGFDVSMPTLTALRLQDLLVAYLVFNPIGFLVHELSHGLACKHYGGEVGEMGVGTMYGVILIAYCDTSSTYLFAERRHKVIVQMAGFLLQTGLWTLPLFLWSQLASDAVVLRNAALLSVAYQVLQHVYTLTPFFKGDGYYALCDGLGILNLRERAFKHLSVWLKGHLLGIPASAPSGETTSPTERALFVAYGIIGAAFTAVLIYGAWFNFLVPLAIRYLGGFGLVALFGYALWRWSRPLLAGIAGLFQDVWKHRQIVFTARRTVGLGITASVLLLILAWPWPLIVDADVTLEAHTRTSVIASEPGLLERIDVSEGQQVQRGQVLAVLRDDALVLEQARAATARRIAELKLERLRNGARTQEKTAAQARLEAGTLLRSHAALWAQRDAQLKDEGITSEASHLQVVKDVVLAEAEEQSAMLENTLVQEGPRPEERKEAQSALDKATALLASLDDRVARLTLKSPIDGVVIGPHLKERWREQLNQGGLFCEVQDLSSLRGQVFIASHETLDGIAPGRPVALRVSGDPTRLVRTVVDRVSPSAQGVGVILETAAFPNPGWPTGLQGHARVYGPPIAVAYQWFITPLLRLLDFHLWRVWG